MHRACTHDSSSYHETWAQVGVRNYVIFAADAEAQSFFKGLGAPSFYYADTVGFHARGAGLQFQLLARAIVVVKIDFHASIPSVYAFRCRAASKRLPTRPRTEPACGACSASAPTAETSCGPPRCRGAPRQWRPRPCAGTATAGSGGTAGASSLKWVGLSANSPVLGV